MDKIEELLTRGVSEIVIRKDLEEKLRSGKKLRVKHGVDPTTKDLHLGHSVIYKKLRKFQDLGHIVIFLIGSFTARFGDPTDKTAVRTMRSKEEVMEMAKNYIKQIGKILDVKKLEIRYNGEWFDEMSAEELLRLMSEFTVARMLERDMFEERMKEGKDIGLHEPVYPVLQAYDSVMLKSDLTVIGNDQKFNELQARPMQKSRGQIPQDVMIMPLLIGTDGKRKMSQSLGNYIGFEDPPEEQYGKIMSLPDELILQYFELCTDVTLAEIQKMKKAMKEGENPKQFKMRLGREIATLYHDAASAKKAEESFVRVFQKGEIPEKIEVKKVGKGEWKIVDLLVEIGLAPSKSEARRLIQQSGIKVNNEKISDENMQITLGSEPVLFQAGKRRFLKIHYLT